MPRKYFSFKMFNSTVLKVLNQQKGSLIDVLEPEILKVVVRVSSPGQKVSPTASVSNRRCKVSRLSFGERKPVWGC